MKPILFNTEMVRAILDGRKTVTRRVVKPQPKYATMTQAGLLTSDSPITLENGLVVTECGSVTTRDKLPYRPGDILYVRETWRIWRAHRYDADAHIEFKAGGEGAVICFPHGSTDSADRDEYDSFIGKWGVGGRWHPSIHMPEEAARLFGRVTDLKVQRVQDITDEEARREGTTDREDFRRVWNRCYAKPRPVKGEDGEIDHYESYPWEDIHENRTYRGKPWYVIGNPWVWVIEFERVTKEEAEHG